MKTAILSMSDFFNPILPQLKEKFQLITPKDLSTPESDINNSVQAIIATPWTIVDEKIINQLPHLKIICCFGTGIDSVDSNAALKRGIIITNTPDVVTEDTSDIAIALILSLARNIVSNDKYLRSGLWKSSPPPLGASLSGKKIGIVGLGKIGNRIAEKASIFGMQVSYFSRTSKPVTYRYHKSLIEMAGEVNFLVVSCPGGEETRDIINLKVLEALGKKGYLVNVARGSTVNQDDLIYALRENIIAGAGLDVYKNEPHVPEDLMAFNNTVLLPHIGTATEETRHKMLQLVAENAISYLETNQALTPFSFK